ncbi:hypothetical protein AGMMS49921_03850 [Endomicrobiia bacterium]|nr:hypothetical protein AGMMS49921_03850 [Endomicrobiia bacterium]
MCIDNRTRNDFSLFENRCGFVQEKRKTHGRYYLVGLGRIVPQETSIISRCIRVLAIDTQ